MNKKKMRAYPVLLLLFACPHGSMRRINEVHTHGHLCGAGPLGVWASSGGSQRWSAGNLRLKKMRAYFFPSVSCCAPGNAATTFCSHMLHVIT